MDYRECLESLGARSSASGMVVKGCKHCNLYSLPCQSRPLRRKKDEDENSREKQHDTQRCDKCHDLGKNCARYTAEEQDWDEDNNGGDEELDEEAEEDEYYSSDDKSENGYR